MTVKAYTQSMRKVKIDTQNPARSRAIQEYLFTQGCAWRYGDSFQKTDQRYLYVDEVGHITYSEGHRLEYFMGSPYTEVKFKFEVSATPEVVKETVVLNGKKYYKEDLEVALQNIKEVV